MNPGTAAQVLTFDTAGQRFALPVADVREILRAVAVTPLPGAPGVVEGVIDIRGEVVPVLGLRARLGLPKRSVSPADHFIVAEQADRVLVLWVDAVRSLVDLPPTGIEAPPEVAPRADFVAGVVKFPDGLTLIQDILRFLSPEEEVALQAALRRADVAEVTP